MADPATITLAVKAAIAAATDKRTWKAAGVVIAAILTPFILIIVMIMSLLSGTADHNNSAVDLTFHGGSISSQVPAEYRQYIEDMRDSFSDLDEAVSEITPMYPTSQRNGGVGRICPPCRGLWWAASKKLAQPLLSLMTATFTAS